MSFFIALLLVLLVLELMIKIRLQIKVKSFFLLVQKSMRIVRSREVSDHWKEVVLPEYSKRIFMQSLQIFFCLFLLCALMFLLASGLDFFFPAHVRVLSVFFDCYYLTGIAVFSVVYVFIRKRFE